MELSKKYQGETAPMFRLVSKSAVVAMIFGLASLGAVGSAAAHAARHAVAATHSPIDDLIGAAATGDARAQSRLADAFAHGLGVEKDARRALL